MEMIEICWFTIALIFGALMAMIVLNRILSPKPIKLKSSHVMITGGSSGIGKSIAVEVVKRGASVSILARDEKKLQEAKLEIETHIPDKNKEKQKVVCISVDVSKDYSAVEQAVQQAESELGTVDMLVNSAGISFPASFEDLRLEEIKKMMDVNYLGSVYATRAALKRMKSNRAGRIVFISSQAGQLGLYGYTGYSPTKYALRGLAEALQMELKPFDIRVCIAFPPDTETPGLLAEEKSKTSGLFKADDVARKIVEDSVKGNYQSYMGLDGYMLSMLTCGMCPATSILEILQQATNCMLALKNRKHFTEAYTWLGGTGVKILLSKLVLTMSLFRLVSLFYLASFDRIVRKCHLQKIEKEASNSRKSD